MTHASSIESLIQHRVDVALANRFRCELASPTNGQPLTTEERRRTLTILFAEIAKGMGLERFLETPVERLDQFAVMSVVKNHDTSGLLRSLVNSFMIAYSCPETADRAFAALLELEALRAELAGCQAADPVALTSSTASDHATFQHWEFCVQIKEKETLSIVHHGEVALHRQRIDL